MVQGGAPMSARPSRGKLNPFRPTCSSTVTSRRSAASSSPRSRGTRAHSAAGPRSHRAAPGGTRSGGQSTPQPNRTPSRCSRHTSRSAPPSRGSPKWRFRDRQGASSEAPCSRPRLVTVRRLERVEPPKLPHAAGGRARPMNQGRRLEDQGARSKFPPDVDAARTMPGSPHVIPAWRRLSPHAQRARPRCGRHEETGSCVVGPAGATTAQNAL
jgi:hypothetical protein